MYNRVTFITAAAFALALLLGAGCAKTHDPAEGRNEIRFSAGSPLLRDDANGTKSVIDGSDFPVGYDFAVFGSRYSDGVETAVFTGETVTKTSALEWSYGTPRAWEWLTPADYYDFVAVSPADAGAERMSVPGNIAVQTRYDLTEDSDDILAATYRRRAGVLNPTDIVPMQFSHFGSAVRVVVINNSGNKQVTLNSLQFKNLTVCGDAKVTIDATGAPNLSWINTERSTGIVRSDNAVADTNLDAGERYTGDFQVMIPQPLDQAVGIPALEENMPVILLGFTPDGESATSAVILLKDILRQDKTPITEWEMGVKYTYYISMRLDGGLLVSLVTTAWDPVEAETPGLLI